MADLVIRPDVKLTNNKAFLRLDALEERALLSAEPLEPLSPAPLAADVVAPMPTTPADTNTAPVPAAADGVAVPPTDPVTEPTTAAPTDPGAANGTGYAPEGEHPATEPASGYVWVSMWPDTDDAGIWDDTSTATEQPPTPVVTGPSQETQPGFDLTGAPVFNAVGADDWSRLESEWNRWLDETASSPEAPSGALNTEPPAPAQGAPQPAGTQVPAAEESPSERQARLEREVFERYPDLAEKANALFSSDRTKWEELKGRLASAFNANVGDDENRSNMRQVLEGEFPEPQPAIRDDVPMPRERTGTPDNLKKWEKEISDYLTASANAKLKAISDAQAELPKDAGNRDYWIKYFERRSVAGSYQDYDATKAQAAVNAEYARMLKDRANFVVGADGKPVAITDEGKFRIAGVAAMIKQFEEYRNKSPIDKLAEALKYARDNGLISGELGRRVDEFIKPANLALFGGFTVVGFAAGGSFAPFVGALGFALLGKSVIDISHDLALGMGIALGATGPNDIRTAAVYLSRGLGGITELGAVTAGGAAAGKALGMGLSALRGKKVQQNPDGKVEVVEPTWQQTPLDRLAKTTDNPNVQRMSSPGEAPKPPGEITPAPTKPITAEPTPPPVEGAVKGSTEVPSVPAKPAAEPVAPTPGVGGNGAASQLPNLSGKSPTDAVKALDVAGFKPTGPEPSSAGWQKFKHPDGSYVDVNFQTGRVVRTPAPKYDDLGRRINKGQRLGPNGAEIPRSLPHDQHPPEILGGN